MRTSMLMMGGATPRMDFVTSAVNPSELTTYTFSGTSFGTVAGRRRVVVGVGGEVGSNLTVISMTIGGVSATKLVGSDAINAPCAIFSADVGSAASGNIVVTFSTGAQSCGIGVYSLYGVGSTIPAATNSASAGAVTSVSANLNVQTGDAVLAYSMIRGNDKLFTWTGVTIDFQASTEGATGDFHSGGHVKASTSASPRTITASVNTAGSSFSICSAVWR